VALLVGRARRRRGGEELPVGAEVVGVLAVGDAHARALGRVAVGDELEGAFDEVVFAGKPLSCAVRPGPAAAPANETASMTAIVAVSMTATPVGLVEASPLAMLLEAAVKTTLVSLFAAGTVTVGEPTTR